MAKCWWHHAAVSAMFSACAGHTRENQEWTQPSSMRWERPRFGWAIMRWRRDYPNVPPIYKWPSLSPLQKQFLASRPSAKRMDPGDLSERLRIKERLSCKPFSWFIEHVEPNLRPRHDELWCDILNWMEAVICDQTNVNFANFIT